MQLFLDKILKLRIGWNERPLTETDFHRLCRRFKITAEEMPLRVSGFYYSVTGRHFIAIDSKLAPQQKLLVMFHEFAHFLLHTPESGATANFHGIGRKSRKEIEADAFALCALIPKSWIKNRTAAELADDEGFPSNILEERIKIYHRYGV